MDNNRHPSGRRARPRTHRRARREHHEELGFWRKYVFSRRSQSDRHSVCRHRPAVPALRLHADDDHAVAARLSGQADSADRPVARPGPRADGHHAARVLQPARRDARHHHGVPRRRAARRRRLRQLRHAAADRRARHGVPEAEHDELLGVLLRRRDDARQLLPEGRRGAVGMDVVSAARGRSRRARRCG